MKWLWQEWLQLVVGLFMLTTVWVVETSQGPKFGSVIMGAFATVIITLAFVSELRRRIKTLEDQVARLSASDNPGAEKK